MNKLKQVLKSKKGFTLMEVIIVVIILAVLAAALIPTFLGFLEQSRHATAIAEARLGMAAAQTVVMEYFASGTDLPGDISSIPRFQQLIVDDGIPGVTSSTDVADRFLILSTDVQHVTADGRRVVGLVYNQGPDGYRVTIIGPPGTSGAGTTVTGGTALPTTVIDP